MDRRWLTGVVLAGGQAKRMGGIDKGLLKLQGHHLVEYVLTALRPQVEHLLISANRHLDVYAELGQCEVVPDTIENYAGPLAGMAASLKTINTPYTLFVPCDTPLLNENLIIRLFQALNNKQTEIVFAHDGQRSQYLFTVLKTELLENLLAFLQSGQRKVGLWYEKNNAYSVDCADIAHSFLNINAPEDYQQLEKLIVDKQLKL